MTVARIRHRKGESKLLHEIQRELRDGSYQPSPCRRKLIPKSGKPGEFRPLGIPTVKDRVVQSAVKQILEPIFEAQFWRISYGFRPGRGCHGALEHIRLATTPRPRGARGNREQTSYPWVIEGDIKGCFDHISHYALLTRIRQRIADRKAVHVIRQFLRAGVLAEDQFIRTPAGTPQGGIISPLLANIALSAIDERYERWVYHRKPANRIGAQTDGMKAARTARSNARRDGRTYCFPIRYADDCAPRRRREEAVM
jgi:group II intron reverse transcriptase/maturase